jgi:hypothetical protein
MNGEVSPSLTMPFRRHDCENLIVAISSVWTRGFARIGGKTEHLHSDVVAHQPFQALFIVQGAVYADREEEGKPNEKDRKVGRVMYGQNRMREGAGHHEAW